MYNKKESKAVFNYWQQQSYFMERNTLKYIPHARAHDHSLESVVGVLGGPYSAKLAQWSSYIGPPGYIGWTRPM